MKDFVVAPKLRKKSATISQVEVAKNSINCDGSAVAAATGRGFESRRPERIRSLHDLAFDQQETFPLQNFFFLRKIVCSKKPAIFGKLHLPQYKLG